MSHTRKSGCLRLEKTPCASIQSHTPRSPLVHDFTYQSSVRSHALQSCICDPARVQKVLQEMMELGYCCERPLRQQWQNQGGLQEHHDSAPYPQVAGFPLWGRNCQYTSHNATQADVFSVNHLLRVKLWSVPSCAHNGDSTSTVSTSTAEVIVFILIEIVIYQHE